MSQIRLIVGLGNPGPEYVRTRHNAGFWFVEELAREYDTVFHVERKFNAEVARVRVKDRDVWVIKPQTFMNLSGDAVVALALYYKILPDEILVVHDELDLMPGTMKIKKGGGNAGHNGLKDISAKLSTPEFWRLRLGVGHPRKFGWAQQVADFVLSSPSKEHEEAIGRCIEAAIKCVPAAVAGDMTRVTRSLSKWGSLPKPAEEKKAEKSDAGEGDAPGAPAA